MTTPSLLTFAPMIDSELSRLLLFHYEVPYREEDHVFGWASILTLLHGGYGRIPILYGGGLRLADPRAIIDHYERICPAERKLIPAAQPLQTQVEADWTRYNGELAADTAVVAYYHLLPHRELMIGPFSHNIPAWEARAVRPCWPALRWLLTTLLRLGPGRAADALTRVRTAFDRADARVADGRPYLAGDRLTLADLSLASAAAPMVLPEGYGAPIPPLGIMPPALRSIIQELRQHPTAAFVQTIYRRHAAAPKNAVTA